MKTLDTGILALYISTAIYYSFMAHFDLLRSVPIFNFAASSLGDVLFLDAIGIVLLKKLGGVQSILFLIMTGSFNLYSWAITEWIINPAMRATPFLTPNNFVFTGLWLTFGPIVLVMTRKTIKWNPKCLLLFLLYYLIYFFVLHAPYRGPGWNTPWEVMYEGLFDLCMMIGLFL